MMSATIAISDWKPRRSGSLRGFVSAAMPSGIVIHEIGISATNGKAWASPPSKPQLDRDGRALTNAGGKRRYAQIIEFLPKEVSDRWSDAIVAALRASHPEVLADA